MNGTPARKPQRGRLARRIALHLRRNPDVTTWVHVGANIVVVALATIWLVFDNGRIEPLAIIASLVVGTISLWMSRIVRPIESMGEAEIRQLIALSDPASDWERIRNLGEAVAFRYRWDNSLEIHDRLTEEEPREFLEPWIPPSWNGNLRRSVSVVCGGRIVFDLYVLNVDGGRSTIPLPAAPNDLRVTRLQDTIARIVDGLVGEFGEVPAEYDRYLAQSKIIVVERTALSARSPVIDG